MKSLCGKLFSYVVLSVCALVFVAPVAFMIIGSLKPETQVLSAAGSWRAFIPDTVSLENYRDVFRRVPFGWLRTGALTMVGPEADLSSGACAVDHSI